MSKVKLLRLPSILDSPLTKGNITSFARNFPIFFFFFTYRVNTRKDFIINTNAGMRREV